MNLRRLLCWLKHEWIYDTRAYQDEAWDYPFEWRTCENCGRDEFNTDGESGPTKWFGFAGGAVEKGRQVCLPARPPGARRRANGA